MPTPGYAGTQNYTSKKKTTTPIMPKPSNTEKVLPASPISPTSSDPARMVGSSADARAGIPGAPQTQATGAAGTSGGAGNSGSGAPMGGFASRYLPGPGSADILQRQPEIVLGDWMKSQGMANNGGMYGMVAPSADLANALYMLTNGGKLGTDEQMINWMAQYFGNQLTPGAGGIDIQSALSNIFNPQAGGPLGAFLHTDANGNVLDPRGQVSRLGSLVDAASQYGVPLIMQQALSGQMGQLSRDYLSSAARGGMSGGNFNDYIAARQNSMLAPFVGR